jgi:hypothetical protein
MKYKKIILVCLGLIILLGVFYKVTSDDNQIGQWSKEEKLEDFNYLYNILKENYPYFEVLKRKYGYDWLAHKEEFEAMIANTKNDLEYYHTLQLITNKIKQEHTGLIDSPSYNMFKEVFNKLPKEYEKEYKLWIETINNKKSQKTYLYIEDLLQQHKKNTSEEGNDKGNKNEKAKTEQENLVLNVIEDNKIAYVKINSFLSTNIPKDGPALMEFWNKIKNYPYLIIDIRDNNGGADLYWEDYIISPLINKTLEFEFYNAFRGGEYSIPFIRGRQVELNPISELPENQNYPPEINTDFKYFSKFKRRIEPHNSVGFTGDIFVLTSSRNFSSAENFCVFTKVTNWATLVGTRTKGDGGDFDPIFITLPNSGLIVLFPVAMPLNPDGTANYEFPTVPDIESEDPLKEVIDIINKK